MNNELKELLKREYETRFPEKKFIPGETPVPISGKIFNEEEILLMTEAVLDAWWTEGRFVSEFEKKFADYFDKKYCITVNSGSSANLLALSALCSNKTSEEKRLKIGDEVITVAAGFPTTINPIIQNGLVPVFCDIELKTYNIDTEDIKKAITNKTKAIFIAHTLGNPFDLDEVVKICEENNLWLIEDNCDALGSKYNNKLTGTFGHLATFSFYPAHHITMGEGGAIITDDAILNKIIRSLRDWGRDCWCKTGHDNTCGNRYNGKFGDLPEGYDHKYVYSELGYNLKTTDIQAALGLAQFAKLESFITRRKENFSLLNEKLQEFKNYFILPEKYDLSDPSWFGYIITLKDNLKFNRRDLLKYLQEKKVGTRLLFAGNITKQPYFINASFKYRTVDDLKNTDKIMNDSFWVGTYPGINKEMIEYIIKCFKEFIQNYE